jgi:Calcineurin-like phosphoesterase
MKNLIIGDVHGHFDNLRNLLIEQHVINEYNERINRETIKCYSVGDLIDGDFNRQGDLLCLEYAKDWFDRVGIGNHEWAFMGGPAFQGLRMYDRELVFEMLKLESIGVLTPAFMVEDYLVVHAGLGERWGFYTEKDALEAIQFQYEYAQNEDTRIPLFDDISTKRGGSSRDGGGIFWNDWKEPRNKRINQIVGHSPQIDGPIYEQYPEYGTEHWCIDAGGKWGTGLWGITLEDGVINVVGTGKKVVWEYAD